MNVTILANGRGVLALYVFAKNVAAKFTTVVAKTVVHSFAFCASNHTNACEFVHFWSGLCVWFVERPAQAPNQKLAEFL